jgi:hypothetical protein
MSHHIIVALWRVKLVDNHFKKGHVNIALAWTKIHMVFTSQNGFLGMHAGNVEMGGVWVGRLG